MKTLLKKAGLGVALAATALTAAAPAEAQRYRGGYYPRYHHYHGRSSAGSALAAGVVGVVLGAALASSANDRRYRERYYRDRGYDYDYDDRYYRERGYYPSDGYYADRYRDYGRCWNERRFDPYYGYPVRVRVCN
jgi:hypothetical protein